MELAAGTEDRVRDSGGERCEETRLAAARLPAPRSATACGTRTAQTASAAQEVAAEERALVVGSQRAIGTQFASGQPWLLLPVARNLQWFPTSTYGTSISEIPRRPIEQGVVRATRSDYPFLDFLWLMIVFFAFVIWIWLLITVFADIFRRRDIGGGMKAIWIVFVILLPYLGVLIYLIAEHNGMADRKMAQMQRSRSSRTTTSSPSPAPRPPIRSPRQSSCSTAARSRRPSSTP